jgi:hypothetical protein
MLPEYLPARWKRNVTCFATSFSAGLLNPDRETPSVVSGPRGKAGIKRYNVYRNNVTVSLIDALAAVFPAVQRITGVEFFRAMARSHTPPCYSSMVAISLHSSSATSTRKICPGFPTQLVSRGLGSMLITPLTPTHYRPLIWHRSRRIA